MHNNQHFSPDDEAPEVVYPLGVEYGIVADGRIQSYRDLRVWQAAMDLVEAVYSATKRFPSEERFGLVSQLQRSAVSVPSNIAEGWGRGRTKEYQQFLRYARASLKEAETQWLIAGRLGYLDSDTTADLDSQGQSLGRQLLALMRALR
ncbi:MAG: four helix bundle protein [Rubricoccaceae bacterium]